jgi:hypothetical protein
MVFAFSSCAKEITKDIIAGPFSKKSSLEFPPNFARQLEISENKLLKIPKKMVYIGYVVRPSAELREGPGGQFWLKDMVFTKGERLVVLAKVGVWRQVVGIRSSDKGWVHRKSLGKIVLNQRPVHLQTDLLPTAMTVGRLKKAYSFNKKESMAVNIPKGVLFRSLHKKGRRTLVWIAESNSVVWVKTNSLR